MKKFEKDYFICSCCGGEFDEGYENGKEKLCFQCLETWVKNRKKRPNEKNKYKKE